MCARRRYGGEDSRRLGKVVCLFRYAVSCLSRLHHRDTNRLKRTPTSAPTAPARRSQKSPLRYHSLPCTISMTSANRVVTQNTVLAERTVRELRFQHRRTATPPKSPTWTTLSRPVTALYAPPESGASVAPRTVARYAKKTSLRNVCFIVLDDSGYCATVAVRWLQYRLHAGMRREWPDVVWR